MDNYDPNIQLNDSTIKVTLQQWRYKGTFEVSVRGGVKGGLLLEMALDPKVIFEDIDDNVITANDCELKIKGSDEFGNQWFSCILKDDEGETLECEDAFEDLSDYIVAVELVSFERAPRQLKRR